MERRMWTNPLLQRCLLSLAKLPLAIVFFLLQVGLLFDSGLVEAVDDGVLALGDEDSLDLCVCVDEGE